MDIQSVLSLLDDKKVADTIGVSTGASTDNVNSVIKLGLPVLLGQLGNAASTTEGADALDKAVTKDHAGGSLLDDIGQLFSGGTDTNDDGKKILGHVFGDNTPTATTTVAKKTGVDPATVIKIMSFVAPIAMAYIGKEKASKGLDAGGLSDMLKTQKTGSGNMLTDLATAFLDKNKDGNIVDDILGNFFAKK